MSSRRDVTSFVAAIAGLLLVLSGCSTSEPVQGGSASRKLYSSAEDLAKDSSVIVQGRLSEIQARAQDDGGGGKGRFSFPMVIYKFSVATGKSASARMPSDLTLAWIDTEKFPVDPDDAAPLTAGREYVFFLEKVTEEQRGGLQGFGTVYVPVSSNAGVFSVENGKAVATDRELSSLRAGGASQARIAGRMAVEPSALLSLTPGKAG